MGHDRLSIGSAKVTDILFRRSEFMILQCLAYLFRVNYVVQENGSEKAK